MMKERDILRMQDPTSPYIHTLNILITKEINDEKRNKWHTYLETFNNKTNSKKLWSTIKQLNGNPRTPPNTSIAFDNNILTDPTLIANGFTKQYTDAPRHIKTKLDRQTYRKIKTSAKQRHYFHRHPSYKRHQESKQLQINRP
jgi:hypothetical protein